MRKAQESGWAVVQFFSWIPFFQTMIMIIRQGKAKIEFVWYFRSRQNLDHDISLLTGKEAILAYQTRKHGRVGELWFNFFIEFTFLDYDYENKTRKNKNGTRLKLSPEKTWTITFRYPQVEKPYLLIKLLSWNSTFTRSQDWLGCHTQEAGFVFIFECFINLRVMNEYWKAYTFYFSL